MKILYAAYRHNPLERGKETGADYHFFHALVERGFDVKLVGPFIQPAIASERAIRKIYEGLDSGQYLKYDLTNSIRASRAVTCAARDWKPDLIFSLYPPPLAFYSGSIPCVFRTDATFRAAFKQVPEFQPYGWLAYHINIWIETRAMQRCALIITHSEWSRQSLIGDYGIPPERVVMLPNPAALPGAVIPEQLDILSEKKLAGTLRLLFVGRDPRRKGLDIALEVIDLLDGKGISATLMVCGLNGTNSDAVFYTGNLSKSDPYQLSTYLDLLRQAHFLIHPARLDPSPRVVAEAAAFGTPTITNDTGGLATTVKHGESGIVLPRNSPPEDYVHAIRELISQPEKYYALCKSTRQRYEHELSSRTTGERLTQILKDVVNERK